MQAIYGKDPTLETYESDCWKKFAKDTFATYIFLKQGLKPNGAEMLLDTALVLV